MPIVPCLGCGQPLGAGDQACKACGLLRDAPPPSAEAVPDALAEPQSHAPSARWIIALAVAAGGLIVWKIFGARSSEPESPAPRIAVVKKRAPVAQPPAIIVAPVAIPAADAASSTGSTMSTAVPDENAGAQLSPVPHDLDRSHQVIYGLAYDLTTKKPAGNITLIFTPARGYSYMVKTNQQGWYRENFPQGFFDEWGTVSLLGAATTLIQERNPPLRLRSDVERRAIAAGARCGHRPVKFTLGIKAPLAELNLAVVPDVRPVDVPQPPAVEADDPPIPDDPPSNMCRFYGIVYDLATKKPIQCLGFHLVKDEMSAGQFTTDGSGSFVFDLPIMALDSMALVSPDLPGYRAGLMVEENPPLFAMSQKERRDVAHRLNGAFEPVPLSFDCGDKVLRLDLVAVPEPWSSSGSSQESAP